MCKVTQNLSSIGSYFTDKMVKLEDKLKKNRYQSVCLNSR